MYVPHPQSFESRSEISKCFSKVRLAGRWPNGAAFWSRIPMANGADACWEWLGPKPEYPDGRGGYGMACHNGKNQSAQKVSFKRLRGPVPKGVDVCHSCDNRACVNPRHLYLAPHYQNLLDCKQRGRLWIPGGMKLTERAVREAFRMAMDGMSGTKIAKHFNVTSGIIYATLAGKKWRDVPRPEGFVWPRPKGNTAALPGNDGSVPRGGAAPKRSR